MNTAKDIIDAIGIDRLATALGAKSHHAVYKARSANVLPSSWAVIVRGLADELEIDAPDSAFSFKSAVEVSA